MSSPAASTPDEIRNKIRRGDPVIHVRLIADDAAKLAELFETNSKVHDISSIESAGGYTTTQAADLLGVSTSHLRRLIAQGKVRAYKVGNQYRVTAREIASQQTMRRLHENPNTQKLARLWDEMGIDD